MVLSLNGKVGNHRIITTFTSTHTMEIKKYDFESDETEVMILLRFSWSFIVGIALSHSIFSLLFDPLSRLYSCFSHVQMGEEAS